MYRITGDFIKEWEYESDSTLKVFQNINNEVLNRKDHKNVRSIARLAWHMTITLSEMMNKAGLNVQGPDEHSEIPSTIGEIIKIYEISSTSLAEEVASRWKDADLQVKVPMYGENWKKGTVLNVLVKHQAHHRGQLTVLMRQNGLKVPGVYGPAKEEWDQMNMPAMD
jgi:uncharacterized damage-inducible protein DinB